jgi:trimethylamine--corrinoid protein Co-methyltransferase
MQTSDHMRFRVLSDSQIEKIHFATLEVLERTGVRVLHKEALKLLKDAGCFVKKNDIVKIPSFLVEKAIRSAPPRVAISNREGKRVMLLEGHRYYFGTGPDAVNTLDSYTGKRRPSIKKDVENAARVCDALENLDFVMSLGLVSDCHEKVSDLHQFQAMLENTEKPIVFTSFNTESLKVIRDISWEIAGGKQSFEENPFVIHYSEVISPLTHSPKGVDKVLFCAENMIPVVYLSGLMSGATGPVTTTGSFVVANAEALSSLVIHQLKRKGAPMISANQSTIMDLKTSKFCHGAPELHLSHAAMADLYHHYRLPIWGTAGASDSHLHDQQSAIECTLSCLLAAQSGCNLIHDVGFLDNAISCSLEEVVMCDEIIAMVKRVMKGFEISDEDLALDVIDRVGPSGEYISDEHTLEHFRTEHWHPKRMNRHNYDTWREMGKKDMGTRLNEEVKKILETYQPRPLEPEIKASVEKIIKDYEKSVIT